MILETNQFELLAVRWMRDAGATAESTESRISEIDVRCKGCSHRWSAGARGDHAFADARGNLVLTCPGCNAAEDVMGRYANG
ncbi:hypothetical protein JR065_12620 [Xanthomonas sp. AmX2]|uniref:hypothetical protein n=1 Tax=Xanthomonas sp. TaxID=29446 RepID=UPI0019809818|nr:hypothetical protein [Xanthomonas sp.]MBN6151187.1 hypothetical protein [Xanthomonas sp.]